MPATVPSVSRRRIAGELWRAIWRFRARVLVAVALLLLAKAATVAVPLVLKLIVDELTPVPVAGSGAQAGSIARLVVTMPAYLVLAYAVLRLLGNAFNELRDVVFANVAQHTVAGFTARTFAHLHKLGARFHARRETGSVIRDLEKGTAAIGFLLGVSVFTIVPTLLEIGTVLVIMIAGYGASFALIIVVVFALYAVCTVLLARRRMRVQREVNRVEAQTNSKVVDSLLNYDTVKYSPASRSSPGALAACSAGGSTSAWRTSMRCPRCILRRACASRSAWRASCCWPWTRCCMVR